MRPRGEFDVYKEFDHEVASFEEGYAIIHKELKQSGGGRGSSTSAPPPQGAKSGAHTTSSDAHDAGNRDYHFHLPPLEPAYVIDSFHLSRGVRKHLSTINLDDNAKFSADLSQAFPAICSPNASLR